MKTKDLSEIFYENKVSRSIYSLNGGVPDDKVCIDKLDGVWSVYYSEKGRRNTLGEFHNEEEACKFMYDRVMDIVKGRVK